MQTKRWRGIVVALGATALAATVTATPSGAVPAQVPGPEAAPEETLVAAQLTESPGAPAIRGDRPSRMP